MGDLNTPNPPPSFCYATDSHIYMLSLWSPFCIERKICLYKQMFRCSARTFTATVLSPHQFSCQCAPSLTPKMRLRPPLWLFLAHALSLGILWTNDQLVTQIDTYTTNTRDEHPLRFELAIAGVKQLQIYALDRTATGVGFNTRLLYYNRRSSSSW